MENIEKKNMEEKIEVNEIFTSIQGEGKFTGYPSTFIRLTGCNLRCVFAGGSICDSAYTSHRPEPANFHTVEEVLNEVKTQTKEAGLKIKHIVITGGEPMRQQPGIQALIKELKDNPEEYLGHEDIPDITIETNGTYKNTHLFNDPIWLNYVDLFSISPKLSTSEAFESVEDDPKKRIPKKAQERHIRDRINYPAIQSMIETGYDFQLKFVYSNPTNIEEIKQWLDGLVEYMKEDRPDAYELVHSNVLVMPEGETVEQITQKSQELADICIREGWKFTDRLHIRIWGDKRAV